jgi:hypothetical protein
MGNTSNKEKRQNKEYMRKKLEHCFLCKKKIEGFINYPNEQYMNYLLLTKSMNEGSIEKIGYSVCGNCNNVDTNRYNIKIHKDRLTTEQYNKLRITPFNVKALYEWDIKNSYYHKTVYVKSPEYTYWKEYSPQSIQSLELDKITINENWRTNEVDYYKKRSDRWEFAQKILGMDMYTYSDFCSITYHLHEKIAIFLPEEGNK